ncbi:MAG: recombination protein NinG [Bacteroidales bacterium]|nr:recombination protein NinG [Bacteroidales bacterium]
MSAISKASQLKKVKKLKTKPCKHSKCKKDFTPINRNHICCDWECGIKYAKEKEAKRKRSDNLKAKKEYLQTDKSHLIVVAQKTVNKYIRLRDKDLPCISCHKVGGRVEAGHFMSVGSNSHIRFDENNIHSQCHTCNCHLSANLINYRINLIDKIGIEEVERLENKVVKIWTIEELEKVIEIFKTKIKKIS